MSETTFHPPQTEPLDPRDLRVTDATAGLTCPFVYFDNTDEANRSLLGKISRGMMFYKREHNRLPNVIWIHPANILHYKERNISGCAVYLTNAILENHYWFYIDEGARMNPLDGSAS